MIAHMEQTKKDYLKLQAGTVYAYDFTNSPEADEAMKEYNRLFMKAGHLENRTQKNHLLCKMIEKVKGPVINGWTGQRYRSREEAKEYIQTYGRM